MDITVVRPSSEYERPFLTMVADFDRHDPLNAGFYSPATADFQAYVWMLRDHELGLNLDTGSVPCTHRWLVSSDGAIVATMRLRHNINTPFLSAHAGHIGYDVAPSYRGRGHGHAALRTALAEARQLGLRRVLLCAAEDNAASRAVIVRNRGELESIAFSEHWYERLCRYWIDTSLPN